MDKGYAHPEYIVDTDWLAAHLEDEHVRVFDCTTILKPVDQGAYEVISGQAGYDAGHIPGAGYLDLGGELSDKSTNLRFMMPMPEQFDGVVGAKGIGNASRVILYSKTSPMWATRLWWMFRAFGHEDVAVLDGGFAKWEAEGRPVSTAPSTYPAQVFTAQPRYDMFTDKDGVLSAIDDSDTCLINNLSESAHDGTAKVNYGRPGRIKSSVNVPYASLTDEQGCLLPADALRERFRGVGALDTDHVVTYCGGGIAATLGAYALTMIGKEDVAVYDGSLGEWANQPELPMERGQRRFA
ncbi:MAG: sulfurtransferase [Alphaproteobacteria bacterium]